MTAPRDRLVALDAFRGLTVILMIIVNNPGSWAHVYPPLRHAAWHGLTPTDLVFPFFLFITGAAMAFSFARRTDGGATRADMLRAIGRRSSLIFACGLLLHAYPFGLLPAAGASWEAVGASLDGLRIMGVLQRIALAWGVAALIVMYLPRGRWQAVAGLSLVLVYEAVMRTAGAGDAFGPDANAARLLDVAVFGADHVWRLGELPFEPEGLVSTLTAVVTVLLGHRAGRLLASGRPLAAKLRILAAAGLGGAAAGVALAPIEPVNKQLWTVSYTVLTAGLAALVLAACLWAVDVRGWRRGVRPAVMVGLNPLVAFLGSGLLARTLATLRVGDGSGGQVALRTWFTANIGEPLAGPAGGSLLYALLNVAVWMIVLALLERRGIRIRI